MVERIAAVFVTCIFLLVTCIFLLLIEAGIARWRDQKLEKQIKKLEDKIGIQKDENTTTNT